jgi:hypothetical protein
VSGQSQSAPPLFITAYNGGAPIPYRAEDAVGGSRSSGCLGSDERYPRGAKDLGSNLYLSDEAFAARVSRSSRA